MAKQLMLWVAAMIMMILSEETTVVFGSPEEMVQSLMKTVLEKGVDINAKDRFGSTSLHNVLRSKCRYEYAMYLINNGADVNAVDVRSETPLLLATSNRCPLSLINLLLEKGADIHANDEFRGTPLGNIITYWSLFRNESISAVELLLEKGADPNVGDIFGDPILTHMIKSWDQATFRSIPILTLLLENGAQVNKTNRDGKTALHYAATYLAKNYHLYLPVVKILVEHGADIHTKCTNGQTLLRYSINHLDVETISFLFKHGADIHQVDNLGEILKGFISKGRVSVPFMKLLVDNGFNVSQGKALIDFSIEQMKWELAIYLMNETAEISEDNLRQYLLLAAARRGSSPMMTYLLENKKVNINAQDERGYAALHRSVLGGLDNIQFLLDHGADVGILTWDNKTILHLLAEEIQKLAF